MRIAFFLLLMFCAVPCWPQQTAPPTPDEYSGMYSFLRDGEFVQITIEDQGKVSGFISRYGDTESDKNTFIDQFFESGKLTGPRLSFATKPVHGTWFIFDGSIERGAGKSTEDEGYYVLRGKLTRFKTHTDEKTTQEVRQVELKSFPRDQ